MSLQQPDRVALQQEMETFQLQLQKVREHLESGKRKFVTGEPFPPKKKGTLSQRIIDAVMEIC